MSEVRAWLRGTWMLHLNMTVGGWWLVVVVVVGTVVVLQLAALSAFSLHVIGRNFKECIRQSHLMEMGMHARRVTSFNGLSTQRRLLSEEDTKACCIVTRVRSTRWS